MKLEEEESATHNSWGSRSVKKKKSRKKTHLHIGPNARAYRAGLAFCPTCDAEKGLRFTEREKDEERAARDYTRSSRGARR